MFTILDEPELADSGRAREIHKAAESATDIAARVLADDVLRDPRWLYTDLYRQRRTAERRALAVWFEARRRKYATRPSTSIEQNARYAETAARARNGYLQAVA